MNTEFYNVEMIELCALRGHPENRAVDEAAVASLRESIAEFGLLEPLRVRRVPGEAGYEVLSGHRRLAACAQLGVDPVPCVVMDGLSDDDALSLVLVSNLERSDLRPDEEAAACAALVRAGWSADDLAQRIKRSGEWVQLRLGLACAPEELRAAAGRREVQWAAVAAVLDVPEDRRPEAVQLVLHPEFQIDPLNGRQAREVVERRFLEPERRRKEWGVLVGG
jgi:ParB family chromosome partitioning protein